MYVLVYTCIDITPCLENQSIIQMQYGLLYW